jgi:hypothetical protein
MDLCACDGQERVHCQERVHLRLFFFLLPKTLEDPEWEKNDRDGQLRS